MSKIFPKNKSGYAILELLFYISFFAVLSLVVITAMITMAKTFKETSIQAELMQTGSIMERMSREIREAHDISSVTTSDLNLDTMDSSGASKTIEFLLSGQDLQLWENGVLTGNLNTPNIAVTGIAFSQINTAAGEAIKIVLTVKSNNDKSDTSVDFYDTVVLRGSYSS